MKTLFLALALLTLSGITACGTEAATAAKNASETASSSTQQPAAPAPAAAPETPAPVTTQNQVATAPDAPAPHSNFAELVGFDNQLPACTSSTEGALYYIAQDKEFQACESGTWTVIDLQGPAGPQGPVGPQGPAATYVAPPAPPKAPYLCSTGGMESWQAAMNATPTGYHMVASVAEMQALVTAVGQFPCHAPIDRVWATYAATGPGLPADEMVTFNDDPSNENTFLVSAEPGLTEAAWALYILNQ